MPNILWYIIIVSMGLLLLLFTFWRRRPLADLLCFFLASAAVAYLLEVIVLFAFGSYHYKPGIFSEPVAEDIFGHLICNGLFWGGFIMLVSAFSLRFYWSALIAVFFMLVEEFFRRRGIYVQYWWRTHITGIGAFVVLEAMKRWYAKLKARKNAAWRFAAFCSVAWLLLVAPPIILLLAGKQHCGIGLSRNYYLDDIFTEVPYCLLLSFPTALCIAARKKTWWKAIPFAAILCGDILLNRFGILTFKGGWNLFYLMEVRAVCLLFYIALEKHSFSARSVRQDESPRSFAGIDRPLPDEGERQPQVHGQGRDVVHEMRDGVEPHEPEGARPAVEKPEQRGDHRHRENCDAL